MSNVAPNHYPPFGLYQGLRYDSRIQLQAVATIAHAKIIDFCAKEGLDQDSIVPRPALGITHISQKDSSEVAGELLTDAFDLQEFIKVIDEFPIPEIPVAFANPCGQHGNTPKALGILLDHCSIGVLKRQADAIRLAAHEIRGFVLPVRLRFRHINLFYYGSAVCRPPLAMHQKQKLLTIMGEARAEVGVSQVYMGKLLVGSQIDTPLPENIFALYG